jgi:hypothetical protein
MIAKQWRKYLVNKLQDHYGLAEEEALKKAEAWIHWFNKEPSVPTHTVTGTEVMGEPSPSRMRSPARRATRHI